MTKYLIDASVIVKSLLRKDESVAKHFEEILYKTRDSKIELMSSRLAIVEMANSFRYSLTNYSEAEEFFSEALELPVRFLSLSKSQHKKAIKISYELGTTVYDTSYHILAKAHGATFLTCDRDYYKKAKIYGGVEYLA